MCTQARQQARQQCVRARRRDAGARGDDTYHGEQAHGGAADAEHRGRARRSARDHLLPQRGGRRLHRGGRADAVQS